MRHHSWRLSAAVSSNIKQAHWSSRRLRRATRPPTSAVASRSPDGNVHMALGFYAALPPELNVVQVPGGAGAGPMFEAAAGYTSIAQAASSLATATDAQVQLLMTTWRGIAADRAVLAFQRHSVWLREVAALAESNAARATA